MKSSIALLALVAIANTSRANDLEFNRDIRPILSDACFSCHGFDAKARKAKLRLDVPEGAFADRDGAVAIKPRDPKASLVWQRIISEDADLVMPPPHTNKKLTAQQKATIRKWIEQGAQYQKHWSFEAIQRPPVPMVPGISSPIDALLHARLTKAGITPLAEADRETLIRRVAFALTGLPPTIREVDEFLADRSPNAYERMVDRYLASPHYGEEMARHWLDVARYADTHGLHLDNERQMWAYRDWVIRAFNQNLSFDRFTIWQVAGDLLPDPTLDQLTATGFNRCNVTTGEGGSIDVEWSFRNAVDRTTTVAQTWLGLTAGCAVCHDHKYDPISQREYYSLYAFFYSSADPPLDRNISTIGPFLKLPTPEQREQLDVATLAEREARHHLEDLSAKLNYTDPADAKPTPEALVVRDVLFDDAFPLGSTSRNTTRNDPVWVANPAFGTKFGQRALRQANSFFHQDVIDFKLRPVIVPARGTLEAWIRLDPGHPPAALAMQLGNGKKVWWGREPNAGPSERPGLGTRIGPLPAPGEWALLSISTSDLGLKDGQSVASLTLQEYGGVVYWDYAALTGTIQPGTDVLASFRVWWKGLAGKAPPELPAELHPIVAAGPEKKPNAAGVAKLRAYYLAYIARPIDDAHLTARNDWEAARARREAAEAAIPGTMIFRDLPKPREAFVMIRGQYDKPGEKVEPGVPAILPPLKPANPGSRPNRLDLANWLVSPENPLVARVAVNRFWQQFFGVGLVKSSADFGSQGEPPSHPELLDWLADEYRSTGWDTKKLVKSLVMSAAFRRDSRLAPAERLKDPDNRLLARGPRFRLDAEQLRDNSLFVSGLLNPEMGGRGSMPYQPPNIWEPLGFGDSNTRYYLQDRGPGVHRRSVYVFIKRTAPHPFLVNFDAPNREQVCAVRDRTNTPLQALQLMNDVQHFEAARALAERILSDGGATTPERIAFLYRTVLSRRPHADEVRIISNNLAKQRALFQADPAAAKSVVFTGESKPRLLAPHDEIAAWTMVANLVLNLDETITRN